MTIIDTIAPEHTGADDNEAPEVQTAQPENPAGATPDAQPDETAAPEDDTEQETPAEYLAHPDPRTLVFEDNIRLDITLDRVFVDSIREHGVLQPVRGFLGEDGKITVRHGKRRVLGAIQAERPTIPVYVVPPQHGKGQRVLQQYDENERRTAMTDADRVGAWKQLQLEGLSVTAIAKATHEKRAVIQTGIRIAASPTATEAITEHELTLDQAATLVEFEDDPAIIAELRDTARRNPSNFIHRAQYLRDRRANSATITELTEELTGRGIKIVPWPRWDDKTHVPLDELTEHDGTELTPESYEGRGGYRVAIRDNGRVQVGHFVIDWKKWGLKKRRKDGTAVTPWTEDQKKERRDLVANNKAWASAETVRRDWLTTFLSRKTMPKNAAVFAATVAVEHAFPLRKALDDHHKMACTLLGAEYKWGQRHPLTALTDANPAKVTTVLLAIALGALEAATDKGTWRRPGSEDVAYFTALKDWGYALSDVENIVLGIHPVTEAEDAEDDTEATEDDDAEGTDESEFESDDDEPHDAGAEPTE